MIFMKKDIHPKFYTASEVKCVCGATYKVGSTLPSFNVEICSTCHPFYSGNEKVLDTAGRVERFKKMREAASKTAPSKKKSAKTAAKASMK